METYDYTSEYDAHFAGSAYIKFYPFVGKKYSSAVPKIMVLGESHYIDPNLAITDGVLKEWADDIAATRYVLVDDYFGELKSDGTHPYQWVRGYRNTAAMITGQDYHRSDFIWDSLSFYNFFQIYVGKGSNGKEYINETAIENSRKAYFEVINILQPNLIIAWGTGALDKWVPQDDFEVISTSTSSIYLYTYKSNPNTVIWHIPHPSRGFSYEWYHDEFLKVAKEINMDISRILQKT